uniref:DNA mismatch repair proteins mutS family domain-containing protein n=1 Tax=Timema monikensis TaxID=170555 RepID=A0A7R9HPF5_9NEOP|nr:unnamed protein product [Timema monikensis]
MFDLNSDTERHNDRTRQLITETVQLLSDVGLFANNLDQEAARKEDKANLLIDKSEFPTLVDRQMKVSILLSQLEALKPSIALVIGSERFEYTSVGGHDFLIEVKITLPVPSTWRLVSQTKQFNRFRSPGVDVLVTELVHLQEILVCDGEEVWLHTLEHFNTFYFPHKRAVKNLATLDVLLSLSEVSRQNEYCKPLLLDHKEEAVIKVEQGRHPIVSLIFSHNSEQYVPNNTELVSSEQCCMIVSGPNMGGKSCYLRQVALIVIMAHIGSFVPAKSATISLLDAVYVRMGARDELFTGRSSLSLELEETQVILNVYYHRMGARDELFTGRSSLLLELEETQVILNVYYHRMGARDELFTGRSSLLLELEETQVILNVYYHRMGARDELFTGRSSLSLELEETQVILNVYYHRMGARDELFTGRSSLLLELEETQVILNVYYHRMGARDELFTGRSSLLLELEETQVILNVYYHRMGARDELFTGRSSLSLELEETQVILNVYDHRMGARDELFTGRSTLLLELEETQVILNCATQHSLVLMDELGRGTSSCDGAAIATATLHHLVKCLTLFVTHYPSVTQLTKVLSPSAQNYHVAFMVKPDDDRKAVTLLYSVVEGLANESFGLNVARLANIRTDVLSRASHYTDILQSWAASTRAAQLKMLMMEGDQARIALDNLFSKESSLTNLVLRGAILKLMSLLYGFLSTPAAESSFLKLYVVAYLFEVGLKIDPSTECKLGEDNKSSGRHLGRTMGAVVGEKLNFFGNGQFEIVS